ncbi:MAG: signal peptidase I, partial [Myxococcaceae bacterium]
MIPPTAPPPRRALPWVAALLVLLFPPAGLLVAGLGPAAAALPLSVVVCGIAVYAFAPLAPSLAAWALLLLGAAFVGMYVVAVVVAFRHGRRAPVRSRRERIWLLLYAVVLCAGWYAGAEVIRRLRTSRTEPFSVSSNSMRPTLLPGDQVLVDRRSVSAHRRGEVVVFRREGQNYLKRVLGLPGEMVEVRGHEVF